jgi:hypothetical protein
MLPLIYDKVHVNEEWMTNLTWTVYYLICYILWACELCEWSTYWKWVGTSSYQRRTGRWMGWNFVQFFLSVPSLFSVHLSVCLMLSSFFSRLNNLSQLWQCCVIVRCLAVKWDTWHLNWKRFGSRNVWGKFYFRTWGGGGKRRWRGQN